MLKLRSYDQIVEELDRLKDIGAELYSVGKSGLGREIYLVTIGKGARRALIVCRQHGNEPTSTEAMMEYAEELLGREDLLEKVRVSIIPLANPDGTELYTRICSKGRTSIITSFIARSVKPYMGDINRDHKKKKFPETRAIAKAIEQIKPDVLLDLHNFFPNFEYLMLRRPVHDFCPSISTNPKIKPEIMRKNVKICKIAIEAVKRIGGNPAEINGLWPSIYRRLLMPSEKVLDTYYSLNHNIPSATFEAIGGFSLCSRRMEKGKILHKASTSAVIEELAEDFEEFR
ncbi:hypothetical protein DRP04_12910 [Archaeoglobales archaeon]|nr:MAG: hypothetical protein DRP04_12910 [Archaeoglobales archaeon]